MSLDTGIPFPDIQLTASDFMHDRLVEGPQALRIVCATRRIGATLDKHTDVLNASHRLMLAEKSTCFIVFLPVPVIPIVFQIAVDQLCRERLC